MKNIKFLLTILILVFAVYARADYNIGDIVYDASRGYIGEIESIISDTSVEYKVVDQFQHSIYFVTNVSTLHARLDSSSDGNFNIGDRISDSSRDGLVGNIKNFFEGDFAEYIVNDPRFYFDYVAPLSALTAVP